MKETYNIKLKQFEGPFDLLLFFIERDEIDILDIPISKITKDYLDYIRTLEELNINVASEFILMAATLMKIKSRVLLPRPNMDVDGIEIDPREELALKLLEYKKFKQIVESFSALENQRKQKISRGYSATELKTIANQALIDAELESLSLFNVFRAFEKAVWKMKNRMARPNHIVFRYEYNIPQQKDFIINTLKKTKRAKFSDIFSELMDRIHAIITFLSLLELINEGTVLFLSGEHTNDFWIEIKAA